MIRIKIKIKKYNKFLLNYQHNQKYLIKKNKLKKKKWFFLNKIKINLIKNNFKRIFLIKNLKNNFLEKLILKKRIKFFYNNLSEKYFKKIYFKYQNNFFNYLEHRLDIILFRSTFYTSFYTIKNIIKKGYITVNNKKITKNLILKPGDIIQIQQNNLHLKNIKNLKYLEINKRLKKIIILKQINFNKIPFYSKFNFYLISEFYKK